MFSARTFLPVETASLSTNQSANPAGTPARPTECGTVSAPAAQLPSCFETVPTSIHPELLARLLSSVTKTEVPILLCIGSDRLIGDSLGPVTGSLLKKSGCCPFEVYGTLNAPVHALNLNTVTSTLFRQHPNSPVIAIDASLGHPRRVGSISLRPGSLRPGAGVNKKLSATGDIAITGITNADSLHPYLALQTARLSTVMAMAEEIRDCVLALR